MKIELIEKPSKELADFFEKRIEEFNIARWEVKEKVPIVVNVTNEKGETVGGVAAKTFGVWLLIDNLWVSEELRGQDYGSKILKLLEECAKKRGCQFSLLDTLNFQARPFYEKFGYSVRWTQNNYPKEGCKYFMVKDLMIS
jgi:GNAT superfamily N-acetyltransferase